ncbi:MAG: M6 family metalloprotease domain-containing protein [Bacteroidales bacterium]|nr:M6 family metalloprotease domain-containing protein [Bacteroidales bacterium]MCM1147697.1 M6 family metalloprotease domain-containing protein [Bacteroidales bacterium]MCM1206774.1 M6 family metalloprotease domain-containing protein [Bacillota bacterium]MCM1510674.1 M6 family metalloprotease domain-containing protein [Clostridium sp.]
MRHSYIKTAVTAIISLMAATAFSVPAKRVWKTAQLTNGTTVEIMLVGDENGHWYVDKNGNALAKDEKGYLYYLTPEQAETKKNARLRRARKNNERRLSRMETAMAKATAGRKKTFGVPTPFSGSKKGLVILVNFSDKAFLAKNTQSVFDERFNKEGYNAPGYIGSVHDYFHDQSYGKFDLTFDVVGPVTVSKNYGYYGGNDYYGNDLHPCELVIEALKLTDKTVNFADYDWDGDGEVDQVFVIYAGTGEAASEIENDIWPHEWALSEGASEGDGSGAQILDGVKIDTYAVSCELGNASTIDGIGTACHEFSHCLGYADLYDTDYSGGQGMMSWDLMDSGSYNGPNDMGEVPAAFTSFERWWAGWLDFTELESPAFITGMPALNDEPVAYKIKNDAHEDEYYLLENRQAKRWDSYTAGNGNGTGHGMMILHVDYDKTTWQQNAPNDAVSRQRMTYFPADNNYGTLINYGGGQKGYSATFAQLAGDPFPGTGGRTAFTDETTPAATLYNANTDGTKYMHKPVTDIKESSDGLISFTFMGGMEMPVLNDATEISANGFTASWSAVENVDSYTLKAYPYTTPAIEAATLLTKTFSYDVTSDGNKDISSSLTDDWSGTKLYESPYGIKIGSSKSGVRNIITPTVSPQSGNITVYTETKRYGTDSKDMTATLGDPVKKTAITKADGTLYVKSFTTDDAMTSSVMTFQYDKDCRVIIEPAKRVYLKTVTIYDGAFTIDDIRDAASAKRLPILASTTETNDTIIVEGITDTHYTLTGLTAPQYRYMVKTVTGNLESSWSAPKTVELSGTGITSLTDDENTGMQTIYNISGQKLATDKSHLKPGIYVIGKKKVIIR